MIFAVGIKNSLYQVLSGQEKRFYRDFRCYVLKHLLHYIPSYLELLTIVGQNQKY